MTESMSLEDIEGWVRACRLMNTLSLVKMAAVLFSCLWLRNFLSNQIADALVTVNVEAVREAPVFLSQLPSRLLGRQSH